MDSRQACCRPRIRAFEYPASGCGAAFTVSTVAPVRWLVRLFYVGPGGSLPRCTFSLEV